MTASDPAAPPAAGGGRPGLVLCAISGRQPTNTPDDLDQDPAATEVPDTAAGMWTPATVVSVSAVRGSIVMMVGYSLRVSLMTIPVSFSRVWVSSKNVGSDEQLDKFGRSGRLELTCFPFSMHGISDMASNSIQEIDRKSVV